MQVCVHERTRDGNRFTVERHPGPPALTLVASRDGDRLALAIAGRLDSLTSPEMGQRIGNWIAAGVRHLTWDLSALEYVSSAGLRLFLMASKSLRTAGGTVRFTAPQPAVREVLGVAGLLTALQVEPAAGAPPA
ncbi:MAG: STAS domain-containing protein [Verrucomicrobia bacterium]|nr:STAS domain-containing protein [Verrucomicrobiota bacterium]